MVALTDIIRIQMCCRSSSSVLECYADSILFLNKAIKRGVMFVLKITNVYLFQSIVFEIFVIFSF